MDFNLPSNEGTDWNTAGSACLLKSSAILRIGIIQNECPIELRLTTITFANDVILAFRGRAVALKPFLKDAIVSKPNRIRKYLPAIAVYGQPAIRFADDDCCGMVDTRPFDGLLRHSTPGMDTPLVGIMAKCRGQDRCLGLHHRRGLLCDMHRPAIQPLVEKRARLMEKKSCLHRLSTQHHSAADVIDSAIENP